MKKFKDIFRKESVAIHIIFIFFCSICVIPFILLVSISLSREIDIIDYGYRFIPIKIDFSAYKYILQNPKQILNAYWVTALSTVIGTFISLMVMSLVAYPLSRTNFKGRKGITFYLFFTMLFNGGLVPSYILITQYLKLGDTFWVLIIPGLVNVWHVILLRTFFQNLPISIFESAKLDGASELKIYSIIVLPLSKPVLATVALFGVLARWNDWYTVLLYIRSTELETLQFLLQKIIMNIQLMRDNMNVIPDGMLVTELPSETARMAMVILAAGPMLVVFPFFQKYFVKGLTVGSVKG